MRHTDNEIERGRKMRLGLVVVVTIGLLSASRLSGAPMRDSGQEPLPMDQRQDCLNNCNAQLKQDVAKCDTFYPPASQSEKHTQCLTQARSKYDACAATC